MRDCDWLGDDDDNVADKAKLAGTRQTKMI